MLLEVGGRRGRRRLLLRPARGGSDDDADRNRAEERTRSPHVPHHGSPIGSSRRYCLGRSAKSLDLGQDETFARAASLDRYQSALTNRGDKCLMRVFSGIGRPLRQAVVTFSLISSAVPGAANAADLALAAEFFAASGPVSVERAAGDPPAAVVRSREGSILGYAFSTRDVAGSVGYSGRPLDIVAAVTPDGIIAGARIVAHEEPILVIGIPREALIAYVANFRGFDVQAITALKRAGAAAQGPPVVAGASVTSAVIRDAI
ncbi:MAG TPA: hypothetical protein VIH40_12960, partial [Xanthobacteraceae bacterium]